MGETGAPHRVIALALHGVVAFDLAITAQVFGHRDEEEYGYAVASEHGGEVPTSTGFTIGGTLDLSALEEARTIVIPGYAGRPAPSEPVRDALRAAIERGARVASVCTGAFALAATGALDGLRAATHWQHAAELQRRHPRIQVDPDVLYLDHGHLATSAGVAAGIDLCLHLVRRDHGADVAARIARRMVVPPHRDGGQAQFIERSASVPTTEGAGAIAQVAAWAVEHLDQPLDVAQLARRAHLSPRQFARRFAAELGSPPLAWIGHQRTLEAQRLLESTDLSLDAIATRSGLGTALTVRRHLRRTLGTSPSAYRRAFRGDDGPVSDTPPG